MQSECATIHGQSSFALELRKALRGRCEGVGDLRRPRLQWRRSGTSKQVRERKSFEPTLNLWGLRPAGPCAWPVPIPRPAAVGRATGAGKPNGRLAATHLTQRFMT